MNVEFILSLFHSLFAWISSNNAYLVGVPLALFSLLIVVSEFKVWLKKHVSTDQLVLGLSGFLAGISMILTRDILFGILLALFVLMLHQTYQLRDAPVWGQLMFAGLITYGVILGGKIIQMIYNYVNHVQGQDERIFATAYILSFYVFILVSFLFFGKKFILVSRLSSPEMIYLALYAVVYVIILRFNIRDYNYLGWTARHLNAWFNLDLPVPNPSGIWAKIIFANFGTFESLILISIFMYFISGWLISFLFAVKPVDDPKIIRIVHETAQKMGLNRPVKVGHVKAPILNAMAYGPLYDLHVTFISDDLSDFTEEDIKGIVGHELGHIKYHHVPLLTLLSALELAFKKLVNLPATQLDYATFTNNSVSFLSYYIISYGLLIFLLIFVRVLEGHADYVTKRAGLGLELAKALVRLEGFYQGVASDYGISVNLLTNRKYTHAEKLRFSAEAVVRLYKEVINPSFGAALSNILLSHPRTSYRINAIVNPKLNPIKGALLPYMIVWPTTRSSARKIMREKLDAYRAILDEAFIETFGEDGLQTYMLHSTTLKQVKTLKGKHITAFLSLEQKIISGTVVDVTLGPTPSKPILFTIQTPNGEETFNVLEASIEETGPIGDLHVLKTGEIGVLKTLEFTDNKLHVVLETPDKKQYEINYFPKRLNEIQDYFMRPVFYLDNGQVTKAEIENAETSASHIAQWRLQLRCRQGMIELLGKDLVFVMPPIAFDRKKDDIDNFTEIMMTLVGEGMYVYTKENFDVPEEGFLKHVGEDSITLDTLDGDKTLSIKMIDFIQVQGNYMELIEQGNISFLTKLMIWWENRKNYVYITPKA